MKKILMMAAFAMAAVTANAQSWIGGNLGYSVTDQDHGTKTHYLSISPEVGFNITDKWAFAVNLDYEMARAKQQNGLEWGTVHEITVNPYARYTFAKSGIASFFVDGGIRVGAQKIKDVDDADAIYGFGFQPGVALQISKKVCLVTKLGALGYRHSDDTDQFGFNVNNEAITFGAYYAF